MASPGERIDLPSGISLFYVDEDHSYWRCKPDGTRGKRLTGVTTVVKPLDFRPDNLMKWAARMNGEGIAELCEPVLSGDPEQIPDALSWLCSGESIWDALVESELTYDHIKERRGKEGTNVHERALRALAMGKTVPDYDGLTDEERGFANGIIAFWLDHDPDVSHAEQVVCDPELGIAGRFDLLGKFKKCANELCPCQRGGTGLVDAKTGGYISEGAHAQVALYDRTAEVCGIGGADWQGILRVDAEGNYELIEVQATHEDALAAIEAYRRAGRISREARKARKAAKDAREAVAA